MTETTTERLGLDVTPEHVALAADWHGGQFSMLYAVASVGRLEIGTRRPNWAASDAEWLRGLVVDLWTELTVCMGEAKRHHPEDVEALGEFWQATESWLQAHRLG